MGNIIMDKELKPKLKEALRRLDDDVREIEEIHEEMDKILYDIEKRISRLRRSKGA